MDSVQSLRIVGIGYFNHERPQPVQFEILDDGTTMELALTLMDANERITCYATHPCARARGLRFMSAAPPQPTFPVTAEN